jgi:hypothetical protein
MGAIPSPTSPQHPPENTTCTCIHSQAVSGSCYTQSMKDKSKRDPVMKIDYGNNFSTSGLQKRLKLKALAYISFTFFTAASISQVAVSSEGQAIVREGKHCPSSYKRSGDYCVPKSVSQDTPAAIVKKGTCPSGYRKNGDYCVARSGDQDTQHVVEKKGACPAGYKKSGKYCVER